MSRRRRSTWGSMTQRGRGVWQVQWTEAGRRRSMTIHGSRADAEDQLARLRLERDGTSALTPTVAEVWAAYVKPGLPSMSRSTREHYESAWSAHVAPALGSVRVAALTRGQVQLWVDGMTRSVARMSLAVLNAVLKAAQRRDWVGDLVTRGVEVGDGGRRLSREILDGPGIDRLLSEARGEWAEAILILCAVGGLRPSEARGVALDDVSESDGMPVVSVRRQATRDGLGFAPVKTRAGVRAVPIVAHGERLMALVAQARERGDSLLTDAGGGCAPSERELRDWWGRWSPAHGFGGLLLRNLRPSAQTALHHDLGVPVDVTSRVLGHASPEVTLGYYDRPDGGRIVAEVARYARRSQQIAADSIKPQVDAK